jgi:hypothetical protein
MTPVECSGSSSESAYTLFQILRGGAGSKGIVQQVKQGSKVMYPIGLDFTLNN